MQVIALIHNDEAAWEELSDEERNSVYADYMSLSRDAREAGVMIDGGELAPVGAATTVRVRDAQTLVTDGPYAEIKEALGGYFLFECASMDEAIRWAARIPAGSARCHRGPPGPRRARGVTMKYALLVYSDQSAWSELTEAEAAEARAASMPRWNSALRGDGQGRSRRHRAGARSR